MIQIGKSQIFVTLLVSLSMLGASLSHSKSEKEPTPLKSDSAIVEKFKAANRSKMIEMARGIAADVLSGLGPHEVRPSLSQRGA